MPSSYSDNLRFNLQATGESINIWGENLNSGVFALADYAIAGWLNKTITGDYTLTAANGSTDEARAAMIKFSGTLASAATITIPSVSKTYFMFNNTNVALTVTTGAGSTVSIATTDKVLVYCDGSSVHTPGYGGSSIKAWVENLAWTYNAGALPAQTGNAGKFVKTDGTTASWATLATTDINNFGATGAQVAALSSAVVAVTPDALGDALALVDDGNVTGTYTPDLADGPNHKAVLTGNITLANLTNVREGQSFYLRLKQDGTGSRLLSAVGTGYKFDGNITPTLSTTAAAADAISGIVVDAVTPLYDCTFIKGYPA